jgi:hypothetical protein
VHGSMCTALLVPGSANSSVCGAKEQNWGGSAKGVKRHGMHVGSAAVFLVGEGPTTSIPI